MQGLWRGQHLPACRHAHAASARIVEEPTSATMHANAVSARSAEEPVLAFMGASAHTLIFSAASPPSPARPPCLPPGAGPSHVHVGPTWRALAGRHVRHARRPRRSPCSPWPPHRRHRPLELGHPCGYRGAKPTGPRHAMGPPSRRAPLACAWPRGPVTTTWS